MFSIRTFSAFAFVTTISGIEALTVRSSLTPLVSDCSAVDAAELYSNIHFDELVAKQNYTSGTCTMLPRDTDKVVAVSSSMGNKCGTCLRVNVPGGGSEILTVFDHSYFQGLLNTTETSTTEDSKKIFQVPTSTMKRLLGDTAATAADITYTEVVCEDTIETIQPKLEFSGEEAYAFRLNGASDAITNVAVYNGDDVSSVEYLTRINDYSSFWVLPLEYRNSSAVFAFEMAHVDPVFVAADTSTKDENYTIEVQMLNVDGEEAEYTASCDSEYDNVDFEEIIETFYNNTLPKEEPKEPEDPEKRESNDDNSATGLMATSFAASTVFAVVSLLF